MRAKRVEMPHFWQALLRNPRGALRNPAPENRLLRQYSVETNHLLGNSTIYVIEVE